jgi:hypothetical protein
MSAPNFSKFESPRDTGLSASGEDTGKMRRSGRLGGAGGSRREQEGAGGRDTGLLSGKAGGQGEGGRGERK